MFGAALFVLALFGSPPAHADPEDCTKYVGNQDKYDDCQARNAQPQQPCSWHQWTNCTNNPPATGPRPCVPGETGQVSDCKP